MLQCLLLSEAHQPLGATLALRHDRRDFREHLGALTRPGVGPLGLPGSAVAELPEVPPHLRSQLRAQVHVLCRLRGEAPALHTSAQLREYLQAGCGGLLSRLTGEWWEVEALEDGGAWVGKELRAAYRRR